MRFKLCIATIFLLSTLTNVIRLEEAKAPQQNKADSSSSDPNAAKTPEAKPNQESGGESAAGKPDGKKPGPGPKPPKKKKPKKCKRELVQSFGFEGLEEAQEKKLVMCGNVTESCCTVADQLLIYKGWEVGHEHQKLKQIQEDKMLIFTDLMKELAKVQEVANRAVAATAEMGFSNCRALGEEILKFNIPAVGPKLKEAIRAMQTDLYESHKGVYCSVCDVNNHEFFHIEKKELSISQEFCRSMLVSSFHVQAYLHVHLKKLINLVTLLITSCNVNAQFEPDFLVPPDLLFIVDETKEEEIWDCREHIDDPRWLAFCGGICESFKPTQISEELFPDMERYFKVTGYIIQKLKKFKMVQDAGKDAKKVPQVKSEEQNKKEEKEKEQTKDKKDNAAVSKSDRRILEAEKETKKEEAKEETKNDEPNPIKTKEDDKEDEKNKKKEGEDDDEEEQKKEGEPEQEGEQGKEEEPKKSDGKPKADIDDHDPNNQLDLRDVFSDLQIIQPAINGKAPLEAFSTRVGKEGVDFKAIGMSSVINEENYKAVLEEVKNMLSSDKPKDEEKKDKKKEHKRKSAWAFVVSWGVIMFALFIV